MSSTTGPTHVLVYPYPSSGHIIPILELTHRLLTRGLTVTVAITPQNLRLLDPFISSDRLHHLLLPNPQIPPSAKNGLIATTRSFRELHYPLLLRWFRSHASPPVAVISDFFLGWTQELTQDVGVRRVVFSPSGALAFSVESAVWCDLRQNESNTENDDDFVVSFRNIPNSPKCPWWQISHLYRMFNAGDAEWEAEWEFLRDCYLSDLASWGIIINSFVELEGRYIDHLKTVFGSDRVWAVGPVLPSEIDNFSGPTDRGGSSSVPCHEVLTWLDSCEDNSVVYVCFGSRVMLTCEQMEELAGGLEKSGVRFILCVPDDDILPGGFDDRVSGRGMVIRGWAPQLPILSHRATGVFLTHCGWNSVLEGITAGVVMLTWPMGADQFINATLVVDELGVGVRVGEESRRIPDSYMLAQALVESVEANEKERAKAKKLKEITLSDVRRRRSDRDLDALVESLYELKNVNASIRES